MQTAGGGACVSVAEVLSGQRRWWVEQGDCLAWLAALPADSKAP